MTSHMPPAGVVIHIGKVLGFLGVLVVVLCSAYFLSGRGGRIRCCRFRS